MKLLTTICGMLLITSTVLANEPCRIKLDLSREALNLKDKVAQTMRQKGYVINQDSELVLNLDAAVKTDFKESATPLFNYYETFEFSLVSFSLTRGSDIFADDVITGPNRLLKRVRDGQVIRETNIYRRSANVDLIDGITQALEQIPLCK